MENDGSTLITFYGAGGVGKSSLLRKLQDEIISLELDAPKIESAMNKNSWLSKVKKNWAKPVAIVDFFLPGANAIATGVSIIGDALINHWKSEDNFDEEHQDIKARLDAARLEKNPYEIYKILPELFAQDVKDWLTSNNKYLVVFLDTYKKIKNFSFVQSEDFIIDDMRVENFSTSLFSFDRSVQSILFPTCDKMIIDKTKAIADKYFSELLDDDTFELEGEFLFCLDYWARLTVRLAETPDELRERYEENFEVHVTGFGEILAWYDIAENILKIFMDEFTEDTGKFNDSQESVAFAYLEG